MVKQLAGAVLAVFVVVLAAPGVAAAGPVQPSLDCVWPTGQGKTLALWGYDNQESKAVELPIGGKNEFQPRPKDRGQPTVFEPGEHRGVFVSEHADGSEFTWKLDGEEVEVHLHEDALPQCGNQPLPASGPLVPALVLPAALGLVGFGGVAALAALRGRGTRNNVV